MFRAGAAVEIDENDGEQDYLGQQMGLDDYDQEF